MPLPAVPYIIPVLSGKGGVGKSSVTVQLALSLCLQGRSVGVLDIDLTGPSIPRLFGVEAGKVTQAPGGWLPVEVHPSFSTRERIDSASSSSTGETQVGALHVMSLGFLLRSRGDAVIWRGPKKTAMVGQLLSEVQWPQGTEVLLIDTPPGTSDEHISLMTNLLDETKLPPASRGPRPALGAVIVTTPQAISTADVRKELTFCIKVGLKVLGVVENMAGYVCPCCGEATNVFSKGGGEVMAREWGVRFLGSVPLDGEGWGMLVEEGRRPRYTPAGITSNGDAVVEGTAGDSAEEDGARLVEKYTSCSLAPIFAGITQHLTQEEGAIPRGPASTG